MIQAMNKILNQEQIQQKITRISHEIIENHSENEQIFIAGICGNGMQIALQIGEIIEKNIENEVNVFEIVIDKENPLSEPIKSSIDINSFKNGHVILVDDVLNSGKTMQYALTKILEVPTKTIKTVALVNRTHRRFPIHCDYVGLSLSTTLQDRVEIEFKENEIYAYLI
jgi:pyrimidine operon attenuation protein / uracil phosphoribosyltransferase